MQGFKQCSIVATGAGDVVQSVDDRNGRMLVSDHQKLEKQGNTGLWLDLLGGSQVDNGAEFLTCPCQEDVTTLICRERKSLTT